MSNKKNTPDPATGCPTVAGVSDASAAAGATPAPASNAGGAGVEVYLELKQIRVPVVDYRIHPIARLPNGGWIHISDDYSIKYYPSLRELIADFIKSWLEDEMNYESDLSSMQEFKRQRDRFIASLNTLICKTRIAAYRAILENLPEEEVLEKLVEDWEGW